MVCESCLVQTAGHDQIALPLVALDLVAPDDRFDTTHTDFVCWLVSYHCSQLNLLDLAIRIPPGTESVTTTRADLGRCGGGFS